MHRPPLRTASAEPATVTVAAAYEGAVTMTTKLDRALTCPQRAVRFSAYNGPVTSYPVPESTSSTSATPAAVEVGR